MKHLTKLAICLAIAMPLMHACNKDKEAAIIPPFSGTNMVGNWDFRMQTMGGMSLLKGILENDGSFTLDAEPYDGVPNMEGVWHLDDLRFSATVEISPSMVIKFYGPVDTQNLKVTGEYVIEGDAPYAYGDFDMEKK